jgi:hypothetical protein
VSLFRKILTGSFAVGALTAATAFAADTNGGGEFHRTIRPLLENYCFDCHADGANKGNVAFDEFKSDQAVIDDHELWLHVLKNLRAGLMPPPKKSQPTKEEKERIELWIKRTVFAADPQNPDPGRVTIRRLNRVEYRNTIRDLLGVEFDTAGTFPPDDTGHGFDNIADVLTMSPLLLEKYVSAANQIVTEAVPSVSKVMPERVIFGRQFRKHDEPEGDRNERQRRPSGLQLSYYQAATASNTFKADVTGKYQLVVALMSNEKHVENVFDYNKCRLIFRVDGKELLRGEYSWEGNKPFHYNYEVDWATGNHELSFELEPLTPNEPQTRTLSLQIMSVKVRGPLAKEQWVQPGNYTKFFPKKVPNDIKSRRAYARELLTDFARRAFRRPADEKTVERLVDLAEDIYRQPGKTFEAGVAQAMVAVLASPKFLFREERPENSSVNATHPFVDEFSLASRLSYFLWSSMPDDELLRLAEKGDLRKNLSAQIERLLKDEKSSAFVRNFIGQWLRTRDIESVPIEARFVLAREEKFDAEAANNRRRFNELRDKSDEQLTTTEREELQRIRATFQRNRRQPRTELTGELRAAMRLETEKSFDYVLREDRSLLELLDADYTFLNERLAAHYGIPNVSGKEMRLVKLPAHSPRGGILTQGTILAVTSNPTRTSPVKRGVFILDNVLGTPPPPPPPDIPPLEDAAKGLTNRAPSLRETLAAHRENALCSSCHNRMDPLGLALENFNAMGMWRDTEYNEPIDATGQLITGETFRTVTELKRVLIENHSHDFYRTVTEKLLTYALGRGLEYYDVETCDQIEARLGAAQGRPSALLAGIIESAAFQKMRGPAQPNQAVQPIQRRADARLKP